MIEQKIRCFYCGTLCKELLVFEVDTEFIMIFKCPCCGRLVRLKCILD